MSTHDDSVFFRVFAVVLGALVIFTLFIMIVANVLSPDSQRFGDPVVQQMLQEQLGPIGRSRLE